MACAKTVTLCDTKDSWGAPHSKKWCAAIQGCAWVEKGEKVWCAPCCSEWPGKARTITEEEAKSYVWCGHRDRAAQVGTSSPLAITTDQPPPPAPRPTTASASSGSRPTAPGMTSTMEMKVDGMARQLVQQATEMKLMKEQIASLQAEISKMKASLVSQG